jgi:protein gp37
MKPTSIEWTDLSADPLKYRAANGRVVWACAKYSAGCAHGYSESIAKHYDRGGPFTRATTATRTPLLDAKDRHHILTAKTIDKRPVAGSKCSLGDTTDVFGDGVPDERRDRLFAVIALRTDVPFPVLTKRAERMREYFNDEDTPISIRVRDGPPKTGQWCPDAYGLRKTC